MHISNEQKGLSFPGISEILTAFGAPVAVVELSTVGASHTFGTYSCDGQLRSVIAETTFGGRRVATAETHLVPGPAVLATDPRSLMRSVLWTLIVGTDDGGHDQAFNDRVSADIEAAPERTLEFVVAGRLSQVMAVDCRDRTGLAVEAGGTMVAAALPTDQLRAARLGLVTTPN